MKILLVATLSPALQQFLRQCQRSGIFARYLDRQLLYEGLLKWLESLREVVYRPTPKNPKPVIYFLPFRVEWRGIVELLIAPYFGILPKESIDEMVYKRFKFSQLPVHMRT